MFDQNNISDENNLINSSWENRNSDQRIKIRIKNDSWNWALSDGEMSPVEEVLSYEPFKMDQDEMKIVASASSPLLNIDNINSESPMQEVFPNSWQNLIPIRMPRAVSNSENNIDLIYNFESFKNGDQINAEKSNNTIKDKRWEFSPAFSNRFKSMNSDTWQNSQTRLSSFETKRQEVLKRRDLIEKQRIDRITQKLKEKEEKWK